MSVAWSWMFDTPFSWTKQIASHFGGVRQGMAIAWPDVIKDKGGIRNQFHHVIDIAPTILEATGITPPAVVDGIPQSPIEGVSMNYLFDAANADAPSTHTTQYFEMMGDHAIYHDGWIASTKVIRPPWEITGAVSQDPAGFPWELYDLTKDWTQSNDIAAENPEKLKEMEAIFWQEAEKYQVLPLDASVATRLVTPRPSLTAGRDEFAWKGTFTGTPNGDAPSVLNTSYTITADVEVPADGGDGMIITQGGRFGGYGLYLVKGKPVFTWNLLDLDRIRWEGPDALTAGKHTIEFDFKYDGLGMGTLAYNDMSGIGQVRHRHALGRRQGGRDSEDGKNHSAHPAMGREPRHRRGHRHRRRRLRLRDPVRFHRDAHGGQTRRRSPGPDRCRQGQARSGHDDKGLSSRSAFRTRRGGRKAEINKHPRFSEPGHQQIDRGDDVIPPGGHVPDGRADLRAWQGDHLRHDHDVGCALKQDLDVQLRCQRAPFRAGKDRRAEHIGRLKSQIGLNPADELVAIAHAMDGPLFHLGFDQSRLNRVRLGPFRSRWRASSAIPALAEAIQAARSRSARLFAMPSSIQDRTTSAMVDPAISASRSMASFLSRPMSRMFNADDTTASFTSQLMCR